MTLIQASAVSVDVYRGSSKDIRVEVKDERGDLYPIDGETPLMRIAKSWTDEEIVLEVEGHIVDEETGKVRFVLEPDDTRELVARGYDFILLLKTDLEEEWPFYIGRLGIIGTPTPGGEE